jgi:hypothetical protein
MHVHMCTWPCASLTMLQLILRPLDSALLTVHDIGKVSIQQRTLLPLRAYMILHGNIFGCSIVMNVFPACRTTKTHRCLVTTQGS